jgi:lysophospholipase L1-like esterase
MREPIKHSTTLGVVIGGKQIPAASSRAPSGGRSFRRFIFHCLNLSLLLIVSIVASEIVLRMSGRVPVNSVGTATQDVIDRIPGMFTPGQRLIEQPRPELKHRVSINSLGFRGGEISAAKSAGVTRILCLGDSFTYGSYVDDDQTLPFQLERKLRDSGYNAEVVNGGVGGTTIVDQLYFLKKSFSIKPDIVLLVFSENDISDLARNEPMYVELEKNRKLKSTLGFREFYALAKNTALFNFALEARRWYQTRAATRGNAENAGTGAAASEREELWRRYDSLLGEMQAYLDDNGVLFAFVIFPSSYRMNPEAQTDSRIEHVEALAKRRGVFAVNLLEPLRAARYGAPGLFLLPYDGHPSPRGYFVAANAIARNLESLLAHARVN